jgi:serine/threonine protein kinase
MRRRIDPSFRALATAGFELAHSFLQLHSKGLCYRDISFGNLFFDPATGEVLICDNDNVAIDGEPDPGVLGTPRFMAPEVVRGEALPSIQTDLFSLAILLFYLLFVHHPLEGKRELAIHSFDLPAMNRLYGANPLFIFDPHDTSNRPVRDYHDNALAFWPIYPGFLRELFTRAFTEGIRDAAHGRVREGEWRAAMVRLRDSILYCAACGVENFCAPPVAQQADMLAISCWNCGRPVCAPFHIRIGRSLVMLNHDTQLFPHHIDEQRPYDFSSAVAEVRRHPERRELWGLKNLSQETWSFQPATDPRPAPLPPGRTMPVRRRNKVEFRQAQGRNRRLKDPYSIECCPNYRDRIVARIGYM